MKLISVHALSLDGSIASQREESDQQRSLYGLTSIEDQARVERLLKESDAVITGSTSLASEGQAWEVKNDAGKFVEWIVLTNKGLGLNLMFWEQSNIERTLVSQNKLKQPQQLKISNEPNVKNICYEANDPAEFIIKYLKEKNAQQVLLFGGQSINKLFFEKFLVTHLEYTICPVVLAGHSRVNIIEPGIHGFHRAKLIHTKIEGDHVFLSYKMEEVSPLIR